MQQQQQYNDATFSINEPKKIKLTGFGAAFLFSCTFFLWVSLYTVYTVLVFITDGTMGFAATFFTTIAFVPQVYDVYKTGEVRDYLVMILMILAPSSSI